MDAQGLITTFKQQIQTGRESARAQADEMLNQMLDQLNPSSDFRGRFVSATEEFVQALQPSWSADDIVDVWSNYYGSEFTDAELDQLLAFYASPLAQREVVVSRAAFEKLSSYFQEQYKPIMQRATAAYVQRLRSIAEECHCKRRRSDTK